MATTPERGIPYASPTDAPDVPYWSQRQAERLEVLLDALDSKFVVDTWTAATIPNGHTPLDGNKVGTRFSLDGVSVEFTGGLLCAANVPGGGVLATVARAANRPATFRNMSVTTNKGPVYVQLQPGGNITLGSIYALSTGDWIDLSSIRFATDALR